MLMEQHSTSPGGSSSSSSDNKRVHEGADCAVHPKRLCHANGKEAQIPLTLGAAVVLRSKTIALLVEGEMLRVHQAVLQQCPYFVARLDRWDSDQLELKLPPCADLADLLLVLSRLYAGAQHSWAFPDVKALMRVAAIAAMLLLDEILTELAQVLLNVLLGSSSELEDVKRTLAAEEWPPSFTTPLKSLTRTITVVPNHRQMREMITRAAVAEHASGRPYVDRFLSTLHGILDTDAIAAGAEEAVKNLCGNTDGLQWLLRIVNDHVDLPRAVRIFARIAAAQTQHDICENCSRRFSKTAAQVAQHGYKVLLERYATAPDADNVFSIGVTPMASGRMLHQVQDDICSVTSPNVLFYGKWIAELPALAAGEARVPLVKALVQVPVEDLANILQAPLMRLLHVDEQRLLFDRLTINLNVLSKWTNADTFSSVALGNHYHVCMALLPLLGELPSDVADLVSKAVLQDPEVPSC